MKDLIANFYELWGASFLGAFSNTMFDNELYFPIALYTMGTALLICVLYYYVIDRPRTAKLGVWAITLLIGAIISFIIAYYSSSLGLTELFNTINQSVPPGFSSDIIIFSLINAMWAVLLMVLLSFVFKWKSTHSSYVPF